MAAIRGRADFLFFPREGNCLSKPEKPAWYRRSNLHHFDPFPDLASATRLVTDPSAVARHAFYPLLRSTITLPTLQWDESGKPCRGHKSRTVFIAAHHDNLVYRYYAQLLSERYEAELQQRGLDDVVLAFRPRSKNTLYITLDAFQLIRGLGECAVIAWDIRKFFNSIDHRLLKRAWCRLLQVETLPADHYAVFKNITRFASVDHERLYSWLELPRHGRRSGQLRRLCPSSELQRLRQHGYVEANRQGCEIPQGVSIATFLSNLYMLEVDTEISALTRRLGGHYLRYCDDILCIVPLAAEREVAISLAAALQSLALTVHPEKSVIHHFQASGGDIRSDRPLQFLGLTFDGQQTLIRSSTLIRFRHRAARGVRLARLTKRKFDRLRQEQGQPPRPLYRRKLYQRYSHLGRRNFISYGLRAARIHGSLAIRKQIKRLWLYLQQRIEAHST
jgi:RNA-directed DNA polymerase